MLEDAVAPSMGPGTSVEVFSRFSASWVRGFEIAGKLDSGIQLRRISDRSILPKAFPVDDVRVRHRDED
jgi:hypothetical protein